MKKAIANLRIISQIAVAMGSAIFLLLAPSMQLTAQAQMSSTKEVTINKFLRQSLLPLPPEKRSENYKKIQEGMISLEKWLGPYQKVQKDGDNYLVVFKDGALPVQVGFKSDKSIESFTFSGCPIGKSLSLSKAPSNLKPVLSKCPNLKP
jgi:hypothetical protein